MSPAVQQRSGAGPGGQPVGRRPTGRAGPGGRPQLPEDVVRLHAPVLVARAHHRHPQRRRRHGGAAPSATLPLRDPHPAAARARWRPQRPEVMTRKRGRRQRSASERAAGRALGVPQVRHARLERPAAGVGGPRAGRRVAAPGMHGPYPCSAGGSPPARRPAPATGRHEVPPSPP